MTRSLLSASAVLLAAGLAAAQPPTPADPAPKDAGSGGFPAAVRAAQEEVELLEAHLATRQAHVKAAEVAVDGPKVRLARLARLAAAGTVTEDEVEAVKVEVRAAEAQAAIRKAEADEVGVRLKQARRRVDRIGRQAEAEPDLRRLAEAAEKARNTAATVRERIEPQRQQYEALKQQFAPGSPRLLRAEDDLKKFEEAVQAAEAKATAAEAELDRLRKRVEGGPGK